MSNTNEFAVKYSYFKFCSEKFLIITVVLLVGNVMQTYFLIYDKMVLVA